ncbi:hypothetical protein KM1_052220 [Entamoeba histolytica HM-3:IMSS]|uniref:Uncharacterized protein n=2 Tax=Entamoeba histolytica TaxID=5759 RepID=M7W8B0_ENTHI|nr:hypothetical protein KM1_052220 [Entamoeba histolytica HM-3:IMSS]
MLEKRAAKKKEIQKRKEELQSNAGLQSQFFDQLIARVQQPTFLTSTVDMNLVSCYVEILKDTKELNKIQYEFLAPFLPLISWQLAHVDLSWSLTQPQNNYQQLEHITTEILRYSCKIIKSINSGEIKENLNDGINNYYIFKQIQVAVSILCGYSEDFSYIEVMKLFTAHQNICYPLFAVSQETTDIMQIAVEGVLHETIPVAMKARIPDALPQMNTVSLKSLLHGAVASGDIMSKSEMEEKGKNVFGKLVEENQTIFNWELLSIGAILQYCQMILEQVDMNVEHVDEVIHEQRVGRALRLVRSVLNFIRKFETIEPTCVGDIVTLANVLVTMHEHLCQTTISCHTYCDYLCECLFNLSLILKEHIGNPVVYVNLEAYIAARLFGSLFSKDQTLTRIIEMVQNKEEIPLPCLHSTALALTFSRDIFSRLQSNLSTVVDASTYKNYSRISCQLEVYTYKFDAFAVQTFEYLTELILSPNGVFLDTLFSLLLTSFIGIGYEEAKEKIRLMRFDRDETMKTYQKYDVDYELTRIVPLYLAVHIFAESPCKALRVYVKQYFSRQHMDSLWMIIIAQSPRVSLNNDNKPPFGPLISDAESITNLRVLLKQLVNNRHITDTNLQILLEKRRDNYPLVVPVELAVFTARLWIHRISYTNIIEGKDDPVALKEWDVFLNALERLIASTDEWKGEECIGYETVCMMLFIFHNLSRVSRINYMRKLFKMFQNIPPKLTAKGIVGLTRALLILDYMLRYHNDFSADLLNEIKNALLSRSFEEHGDLVHDTCIIPAFIEKLNYSDALASFAVETHDNIPPSNGYIRFYGFTKYDNYDNYLSDLRLGMHYPLGSVVMLTNTADYSKTYERLLGLLRDCIVEPPKNPILQSATFILGEYYFNSLWMIMCLLPPPQSFIDQFKDRHLFEKLPIGNLLLHYVNWMTNLCYLTDKQRSKFYKEVDISNMRIKNHIQALVEVLQKIKSQQDSNKLIRIDAIVETIIQFITCASLNGKYLDLYRTQLALRKKNHEEALKVEKLTQTEEDKKKFEKAIKEMKEEEEKRKVDKEEKKRVQNDLKKLAEEEKEIRNEGLLKGLKNLLKKDSKINKNEDIAVEALETKVLESDTRRKRKLLKKREEWSQPIDSPEKLNEGIRDIIFKSPKEFFEICGALLEKYVNCVKSQQLGGIIGLDRGIIVDTMRGNNVNWKKDAIINVLFEGVQQESLNKYISSMVLTDETIHFITDKWGTKLYLWKDEFYHPLQHILDASVSCPIRLCDRAYFATVSSTQKIVKSIITLSTLISIQANVKNNFESTSLMNTLLMIIPDKGFKYTQERAIELALRMGGEQTSPILIEESKLFRGDQFLNFILQREKVDDGTVECVTDCLNVMEQAVKQIKQKVKKVDYYLNKTRQFGESDMKLYLLVGGKVKDKVVLRRIEEYLQTLMEGDEEMKKKFSSAMKGWKNPAFGEWCIQKIIGTEENKKFVESGEKESNELFDFFETVMGKEETVKKDILEKLIESVPLVVESNGQYIKKYFRTIFNYVSKQKEGKIIVNGIMKWFESITIEKAKSLKDCEPFSELLRMVYYLFCQIKDSSRRTGDMNYISEITPKPLQCSKELVGPKPFLQKMFSVGEHSKKKYLCVDCSKSCVERGVDVDYVGMIEKSCECEECKCKKPIVVDNREALCIEKITNREMARLFEIDIGCKKSEVQLDNVVSKAIEAAIRDDNKLGEQIFNFFVNMSHYMFRASVDEISFYDGLFNNSEIQIIKTNERYLSKELITKEQLQLNNLDEVEDEFFISEQNILSYDGTNRLYRVVDEANVFRGSESFSVEYAIRSIKAHKCSDGILLLASMNNVDLLVFDEEKLISIVNESEDTIIHKIHWLGTTNEFAVFTDKFVRIGKYENGTITTEEYSIDSIIYSGVILSYTDKQYVLIVSNQNGELFVHIVDRPLVPGRFKILNKHITLNMTKRETIVFMDYLVDIDAIALSTTKHCIISKFDSCNYSLSQYFIIPRFSPTCWVKLPYKRSFYMTYSQKSYELQYVTFKKECIELDNILNKPIGGIALEPRVGSISIAVFNEGARSIDYISETTTEVTSVKGTDCDITKLAYVQSKCETDNTFNDIDGKKVYYNRLIITNLNKDMVIKVIRLHFKADTIPIKILVKGREVTLHNRGNILTVPLMNNEVVVTDPKIDITLFDCITAEHLSYPSKVEAFGISKNVIGFNELRMKVGLREEGEQLPLIMPIHHICNTTLMLLLRYFELNMDKQTQKFINEVNETMIEKIFDPVNAFVHDSLMQILRYLSPSMSELKQNVISLLIKELKSITPRHAYRLLSVFLLKAVSIMNKQPSAFKTEDAQNAMINLIEKILLHIQNATENRSSMVYQCCKLFVHLLEIRDCNTVMSNVLINYLSDERYGVVALDALCNEIIKPIEFNQFKEKMSLKLKPLSEVNCKIISSLISQQAPTDPQVFLRVCQLIYVCLTTQPIDNPNSDLLNNLVCYLIKQMKMFSTNPLIAFHSFELIRALIKSFDGKAYDSFVESLRNFGEPNFFKGNLLIPSVSLSRIICQQMDCKSIEDILHNMISKEIDLVPKNEITIMYKGKHHAIPLYKTKEMKAVDLTIDILQTLFYLQVSYRTNKMPLLNGDKWKGVLEAIIQLETQGNIPRGVVSKQLLYELSGSSYLYHQATDKKKYERVTKLLEGKERKEITDFLVKTAKLSRKRPSHWQKFASENKDIIQLLLKWIKSEVNEIVLPAVQMTHSLIIDEVKAKDNISETELFEMELINKELKQMSDLRKKVSDEIINTKGIGDIIRMTAYDKCQEVRELLEKMFKIMYRDSYETTQKKLWGYFCGVLEHPQADVLNEEFISTMKTFAFIIETHERKVTVPLVL